MLPLLNHFAYTRLTADISIPNAGAIDDTNSPLTGAGSGLGSGIETEKEEQAAPPGALGRHASGCRAQWGGVKPVFVLVDFFDRGPAIETADRLNGIAGAAVGREEVPRSGGAAVAAASSSSSSVSAWRAVVLGLGLGLVLVDGSFVAAALVIL